VKNLSLGEIAAMSGGKVTGDASLKVSAICTDTRTVQPGSLFLALKGERFDGHDFVKEALGKGAVAALVSRPFSGGPHIEVEDTLVALQHFAKAFRLQHKTKVVAVTGSNGKSSTKEMIASVLSRRFCTHKTQGNFNNHIGLPLTLLGLEDKHEFAVVEIGMNHPGEIAPLASLAVPDVAVVTNVGWAHIEAFENQDAIADEKNRLVEALSASGLAVLNGDDPRVRAMASKTSARACFCGVGKKNDYRGSDLSLTGEGMKFLFRTPSASREIELPIQAPHMLGNALLAAAVGVEFGLTVDEIAEGLAQVKLPKGRCQISPYRGGWLIDDTYNANPDSMIAGFEMVRQLPGSGRNVALLGAMGELGKHSRFLHEKVGSTAVEKEIGLLFALGEDSRYTVSAARSAGIPEDSCRWFENHQTLASSYRSRSLPGDRVLVKGSRSQTMEHVVSALKEGGV